MHRSAALLASLVLAACGGGGDAAVAPPDPILLTVSAPAGSFAPAGADLSKLVIPSFVFENRTAETVVARIEMTGQVKATGSCACYSALSYAVTGWAGDYLLLPATSQFADASQSAEVRLAPGAVIGVSALVGAQNPAGAVSIQWSQTTLTLRKL